MPIDTLRKEFGISNVALGKICRHRQFPVSPRGYWAKKYAGHKMKPPPRYRIRRNLNTRRRSISIARESST
jgi:hypothetical protein